MLVVVDPGHQARADPRPERVHPDRPDDLKARCAPGSRGALTRQEEHELTLDLSLRVQAALARLGGAPSVRLTRTQPDVRLANRRRAEMANDCGADLFLRIHADGWRDRRGLVIGWHHGPMAVVSPRAPLADDQGPGRARAAARVLLRHVATHFHGRNRGVRERSDLTGLNWAEMPALVLEVGSLGHPRQDLQLGRSSFRQRVAGSIALALVELADDGHDAR